MIDLFNRKRVANLKEDLADKNRLLYIAMAGWRETTAEIKLLKREIAIHNRALAMVIAKANPMFGIDELDPSRRAESDAIGERVLERIKAEYRASNKHLGDNAV